MTKNRSINFSGLAPLAWLNNKNLLWDLAFLSLANRELDLDFENIEQTCATLFGWILVRDHRRCTSVASHYPTLPSLTARLLLRSGIDVDVEG